MTPVATLRLTKLDSRLLRLGPAPLMMMHPRSKLLSLDAGNVPVSDEGKAPPSHCRSD
jgi:hypothetical protein